MLPPGHMAAGYLAGVFVAKALLPQATPSDLNFFGLWGAFWGFAPDLDEFWFFLRNRSFLVAKKTLTNHRKYFTHAPVIWFFAGIFTVYVSRYYYHYGYLGTQIWLMGYIIWASSWSHFILDSIEYGIMWLWPKQKLYALVNREKDFYVPETSFIRHSWHFLKEYAKTITFYLEILIIISSIIIYFKLI